jgi:hypothetical protein
MTKTNTNRQTIKIITKRQRSEHQTFAQRTSNSEAKRNVKHEHNEYQTRAKRISNNERSELQTLSEAKRQAIILNNGTKYKF